MNAEEIRQMRTLLAAQPASVDTRPPALHRKLKTFLTRKPASGATDSMVISAASAAPVEPESDLLDLTEPTPGDPVPPELLLGGLAPRRPAFGQRIERVLELDYPAPAEPRRLILCAAGGEAVGEIILHSTSSLHAEAPFFPEDLADEPFTRPKPPWIEKIADKAPVQSPEPPAPELAATFLLANLAARLASEEAALTRRLTVARSLFEAA